MPNDYILTSDSELYHYGVPGMKWGVRRDRARRARMGGRLDMRIKEYDKYISYREVKKKRNAFRGKSNATIDKQLKEAKTTRNNLTKLMNKTVKDLSKKEIERGKRQAQLLFYMGGAIGATAETIKVERFINKQP